jgi:hypothetical protein
MATSDHYRTIAATCMKLARECVHPELAGDLQALAAKYLGLANEAARPQPRKDEAAGRR